MGSDDQVLWIPIIKDQELMTGSEVIVSYKDSGRISKISFKF
jgi:hypothetical protein